ncbi:unnamed protein product [Paramecium octaurelia]|uniref:Uncharacterized protein n=1 Tax=Paramecium octaurelia TaxID=43137 RepID=A0A8S1YC10_PAROT|nr:unnamed protein product [Paramecium octaurelia]CAD8211155.1 unnamed protein product [Paramecium octaurelia]
MQESDIESQFLYQSIIQQQEGVEEKQILVSRLTESNQMQDESVQINLDSEIITQLREEIGQLQKLNQNLTDQIKEKDNQIAQLNERVQRQSLLNETFQIAEVQLKQQVEELKKKIAELQEQITSFPPLLQSVSKPNLDFSWVNHMERDLSHDGLLERYDRYKSNKRLAPIQVKPYSEKFKYNNQHNSPYFEQLTERTQNIQRKRINQNKQ